jgi:two-component system, OmpR family, alkaline phosphatase synthesis response regulator PhoP
MGADDYVTTPFGCMELLARVAALLRRGTRSRAVGAVALPGGPAGPLLQVVDGVRETDFRAVVRFGDVVVDLGSRVVTRAEAPVRLKRKEFDLLLALIRRGGAVAPRAELLREVWGYGADVPATRTVDIHVAELRRKLEPNPAHPRHILTVYKVGYRFQP